MASHSIAVLDDDPEFRQFVSIAARSCGFETYATTSADAFEHYLAKQQPDLAMLELSMHEIDGIALMARLAQQRVSTPLLIVAQIGACMLQVARRLAEAQGLRIAGAVRKPMPAAALCRLLAERAAPHRHPCPLWPCDQIIAASRTVKGRTWPTSDDQ